MERGRVRRRGIGRARGRGRVLSKIVRRWRAGVDRPDPRLPREPPRLSFGQSYYTRIVRTEYTPPTTGQVGACTALVGGAFSYATCFYLADLVTDAASSLSDLKKLFNEVRLNYVNIWIMPAVGASASGNYCARVYDGLSTCLGAVTYPILINGDAVEARPVRQAIALKWRRTESSEMDFISINGTVPVFSCLIAGINVINPNQKDFFPIQIVTDSNVTYRSMRLPVRSVSVSDRALDSVSDDAIARFVQRIKASKAKDVPLGDAPVEPPTIWDHRSLISQAIAATADATMATWHEFLPILKQILGKMNEHARERAISDLPLELRTRMELEDWVTDME